MEKTIQQKVNDLMIDFPNAHAKIANVLERLKHSHYTYEEAKELMLGEFDALESQDEIIQDSIMWDEIRELQHAIINHHSSENNLFLNNLNI
jgi:hypothetical protein